MQKQLPMLGIKEMEGDTIQMFGYGNVSADSKDLEVDIII